MKALKKTPQRFLPKALLVATLAVFGTVPVDVHAEFVVGVAAPLTGPNVQIGRSIRNGAALALEIAEDSGKFGEVRLSIRSVDDTGPPKQVAERIARFVRDELAILVIGPTLSTHAEATADLANHAKFPLLAPGTSEGINATGKWAFRLSMSPYRTIHALAAAAVGGAGAGKKVALVHMQGNRGYAAQAAEFRLAATRAGATIAADLFANILDTDVVETAAKAIRASGADVAFLAMDAEPGAAIARALDTMRGAEGKTDSRPEASHANKVRLVFPPAAANPALLRIGGTAVEGALTAADYLAENESPENAGFRNAYRARYGVDADNWAGLGFAAGQLAAEAVRNAGPSPDTETMRTALERVNNLRLLVGQGAWQQDALRNPSYTPQLYVMRQGKLEAFAPGK
jgi:branched-chain amino acid transport system substrate-binding protein